MKRLLRDPLWLGFVAGGVLVASCGPEPVKVPAITDTASADLAHRVAVHNQELAQIAAQGTMVLWAFAIGGLVGMAGLLLILLSVVFKFGRTFMLLGAGLIVFGAVVCGIAMAFPRYGQQIALGAAIMVGLVLAAASVVGFMVGRLWYIAFKQSVLTANMAKEAMAPETREAVFGDNGIANEVQSKTTQKIVATVRKQLTKEVK